jgi:hypothetical protein
MHWVAESSQTHPSPTSRLTARRTFRSEGLRNSPPVRRATSKDSASSPLAHWLCPSASMRASASIHTRDHSGAVYESAARRSKPPRESASQSLACPVATKSIRLMPPLRVGMSTPPADPLRDPSTAQYRAGSLARDTSRSSTREEPPACNIDNWIGSCQPLDLEWR